MAYLTYKRDQPETLTCKFSGITAIHGADSPCCEGLIQYEPVIIDFEDNTAGRLEVLKCGAHAICLTTQFQTIWLLDVKDIILMGDNKLGVKFDNLLMY
jgi:hypothetical protein